MQDMHAKRAATTRSRRNIVALACAVSAVASMGWLSSATAAGFLKLSGIPGESTDERHKGEIDILSYDLAIEAPPTATVNRPKEKPSCAPVTLAKNIDSSSLVIAKKLAQGVHIPEAVLTFQRDGAEQRDYLIVTMREILVTDFSQTSSGDFGRVLEKVVLMARQYNFEYRPQSSTGDPAGAIKFGWDCVTTEVF